MRTILRPLVVGLLSLIALPTFAQAHLPVVRGYAYQATVTNSLTLSYPSSSAVGDLAVLFFSAGDNTPAPTGWTTLYSTGASNWATTVAWKTLTSGDIGSHVTINVANGVIYDMHGGLAVYQGSTVSGVLEEEAFAVDGDGDQYLNTSSNPIKGDDILFWATNREDTPTGPTQPYIWDGQGNPVNGTPNVISLTLETANAWSVFEWQPMQAGEFGSGFYLPPPGGGLGYVGVQVVVKCHAVNGTCIVN